MRMVRRSPLSLCCTIAPRASRQKQGLGPNKGWVHPTTNVGIGECVHWGTVGCVALGDEPLPDSSSVR